MKFVHETLASSPTSSALSRVKSARAVLATLVIWAQSMTAPALAQTPPNCDYSAKLAAEKAVVIDANSGEVLSNNSQFPEGESVALHFVNKNPYAYKYTYVIKGVSVDATTIRAFLEKIGALAGDSDDVAAQILTAMADPAKPKAQSCGPLTTGQIDAIYAASSGAADASRVLNDAIERLAKHSRKFDDGIAALEKALPISPATCTKIDTTARSLPPAIAQIFATGPDMAKANKRLSAARDTLTRAIDPNDRKAMEAASGDYGCRTLLGVIDNTTVVVEAKTKVADAALKKLATIKPALDRTAKLVADVQATASAYIETRRIGPADEATDYSISITRVRRANDKDVVTQAASSRIRLGKPRVSYTLGASTAFANQVTYGRAASVSDDGSVVSIISENSTSDIQYGLVGQLNFRLSDLGQRNSWGWALGAALSEDGESADLRLYTGPYFNVSKRFYVTAAYYSSETTRLAGGFAVDDVVPTDLEGEIPTTTKRSGEFMLTFTYDFQ